MQHDSAPAPHRRTIRLPSHDYAQTGAYFVTVCTHDRQYLFGHVMDDTVRLSAYGEIAANAWEEAIDIRAELTPDAFVVMPNHIHGIVVIVDGRSGETNSARMFAARANGAAGPAGAHPCAPTQRTGGQLQPSTRSADLWLHTVAAYKGAVTAAINTQRGTPGAPIWQRNYYEHIIRNEEDLNRIREYIFTNPARWSIDPENITHL